MAELVLEKDIVDENSALGRQIKASTPPAAEPTKVEPTKVEPTKVEPTAVEPVKVEPTKVEPTKVEPTSEELEGTVIEQVFGQKISKADAKKLVENLPTIFKEYQELKEKPSVTFTNDWVKGLNDYLAQGGNVDTYNRVQSLDIDKLEGIEAIKAQYKWEHPQLTDAQIEKKLNKLYNQTEDATDEEKELGQVDIAIDAKKAKAELLKVKQENSIPETERLRLQEEKNETQRLASWSPAAKAVVKDFSGFDIPLAFDKDGKATDVFKFTDVSDEVKKTLEEDINLIISESGLPYTQEGVTAIKELVQERFIVRNFSAIVKALFTEAETRATKKANDEYRNGTLPKKGDTPPASGKSNVENLFESQLLHATGK